MGHRGVAGLAPENTLPSFRKVAECGLEWVEFDVMLTGDGVPVLFHDDDLKRTTGISGLMAETPAERVLALDAGVWFAPEFAGATVPSLEESIELALELGLRINMEIKPSKGANRETATTAVSELSRIWPETAPVPLVCSFETDCLEIARDLRPDWPRALVVFDLPKDWREQVDRLDCASFHIYHGLMTEPLVREVKAMGLAVASFTVNELELARRLYDMGVDCLITDDPPAIFPAVT
jgi:glycerophosphoryl diester phosphodiesterase